MELQKSLLDTQKFFSRFFNTLTAEDKYSLISREIECKQFRRIYLKNRTFTSIFLCIFRIWIEFRTFWKKDDARSLCISEITDHEIRA